MFSSRFLVLGSRCRGTVRLSALGTGSRALTRGVPLAQNALMPQLVEPCVQVHASFLAAMSEFRAERRGGPDDDSMIGSELRAFGADWEAPEAFAGYVEHLRAQAPEETARPPGWVPCTTLWYVEASTYLGRLAIRHRLTPQLLEVGGHIGYDVRPTARRRGHATAMLRAALPVARGLGIDRALVTCDTDNVGSRRVIEANGGVLEDERHGKLRFWVPTARTPLPGSEP